MNRKIARVMLCALLAVVLAPGSAQLAPTTARKVMQAAAPTAAKSVYLPSIVSPPPACPNDVEDNDRQDEARQLTLVNQACIGSLESDEVGGDHNDDWYWLDLPPGITITVDLVGLPADADYDLALYRFKPQFLKVLPSQRAGAGGAEHITYTQSTIDPTLCNPANPPESGCLFILVRLMAKSAGADNYTLKVTITSTLTGT